MLNPATRVVTEDPTPCAGTRPIGITAGPDDHVWFADRGNGSIGVVTLNQTSSTLTSTKSNAPAVTTTTRTPDPWLSPLVSDSPDL